MGEGLNRLYFLYEAYDDYWDFARPDLHNDTFEIAVDADRAGGPLIDERHPNKELDRWDAFFSFHSVHAQNYHTFAPAEGKDWTMMWGPQQWLKQLPYSAAAYSFNFKPGQSGRLVMEFWITPFDYAGAEGPVRAVESLLTENKLSDSVGPSLITMTSMPRATMVFGIFQASTRCMAGRLNSSTLGSCRWSLVLKKPIAAVGCRKSWI